MAEYYRFSMAETLVNRMEGAATRRWSCGVKTETDGQADRETEEGGERELPKPCVYPTCMCIVITGL